MARPGAARAASSVLSRIACLGALTPGGPPATRLRVCGHPFHAACAAAWLVARRHNRCPLCARRVVAGRDGRMGRLA